MTLETVFTKKVLAVTQRAFRNVRFLKRRFQSENLGFRNAGSETKTENVQRETRNAATRVAKPLRFRV